MAYQPCKNIEEGKKELNVMLGQPLESLSFIDLLELHAIAPELPKNSGRGSNTKDDSNSNPVT